MASRLMQMGAEAFEHHCHGWSEQRDGKSGRDFGKRPDHSDAVGVNAANNAGRDVDGILRITAQIPRITRYLLLP